MMDLEEQSNISVSLEIMPLDEYEDDVSWEKYKRLTLFSKIMVWSAMIFFVASTSFFAIATIKHASKNKPMNIEEQKFKSNLLLSSPSPSPIFKTSSMTSSSSSFQPTAFSSTQIEGSSDFWYPGN